MFILSFGLMIVSYLYVEGKVITNQHEWNSCCPHCSWEWPYTNDVRAICQYYLNRPHYATLYSITNRIPIFSQFTLSLIPTKAARIEFAVEPQLIDFNLHASNDMTLETDLSPCERRDLGRNQATLDDFKHSPDYNKGHLNPSAGHSTPYESKATFTLTNVVPQENTFNQGCWNYMENATRKYVISSCHPNAVVVGAVPGFGHRMHGRVNVPAYMWSTIQCNGTVVAFLAPNVGNNQIEQNKLMTLFYFHENFIFDFNESIKALYDARNNNELENSVRELKTNRDFFATNPPEIITQHNPLNLCLAHYGVENR